MLKKYGWILFALIGALVASAGAYKLYYADNILWYEWILAALPLIAYFYLLITQIKKGW